MARLTTSVGLAVILVVTCVVENAGAEMQPLRLGIRLSHRVDLPQWVLADARDIVTTVYARAGVEVVWGTQPDGATPALQVTVILTAEAPEGFSKKEDVLGVAIGAESGCGRLAYVVWSRVAAFAHAKRVEAAKVLGRVIAHEIGHLLLGHNAHSGEGIMRANWNTADFASIDNRAVFSPEQSARVREQILNGLQVASM